MEHKSPSTANTRGFFCGLDTNVCPCPACYPASR
nr:MAG TPA: hypothetical protein [Caudoviricetes sp.]